MLLNVFVETVELFMGLNGKWKKSHNRGIIKYAAFAQIMQKSSFKLVQLKLAAHKMIF